MIMTPMTTRDDDFETIVAEELEYLRAGERRLQQMYRRLKTKPQLMDRFKSDLAEMRQRVDRLYAVLNPFAALSQPPAPVARVLRPTAA